MVIEGAGGILVPINDKDTILDLISSECKVLVVARHYLGSINHTLMTAEVLSKRGVEVAGIIFVGDENKATEGIILKSTGLKCLARIPMAKELDCSFISEQAGLIETDF